MNAAAEKGTEEMDKPNACRNTGSSQNFALLQLLEDVNYFANTHTELSGLISDGFFQLAISRKNIGRAVSVSDIREEFDSTVLLSPSQDTSILEVNSSSADDNPLLMFSAMPAPALRRAQACFTKALEMCVLMCSISRRISASITSCDADTPGIKILANGKLNGV